MECSARRGAARVRLWLGPGSYRVEVHAADGRSASTEVSIASLDDRPEVVVELPRK